MSKGKRFGSRALEDKLIKENEMPEESENSRKLSRRQFVKGAAAGAVGMAAVGALGACGETATSEPCPTCPPAPDCPTCPPEKVCDPCPEPEPCPTCEPCPPCDEAVAPGLPDKWDYETDVVVCGYGAAGSAAAIEAHDAGAEVLIIEKKALPGGSIARCGGAILGAGTAVQKAAGIDDSAEKLYEWIMTSTGGLTPEEIAKVYCENTGPNVDWLQKLGEEFGVGAPIPEKEGGMGYGGVDALGATYEVFGFDEVIPRSHWATPKEQKPGEHSGPELFTPLYAAINAKGIEALFETALEELVYNGTEVVGVKAESKGKEIYIKAKKGVVLGTGGFGHNDVMKQKYNPDMVGTMCYMTDAATGEGILAAQALGADLNNMSLYYPHGGPHYTHSDPDAPYYIWGGYDPGVVGADTDPVMAETHGGVVINPEAEVMNVFSDKIPRLYASGCVVGSNVFGRPGNYPGCGCYVSFAVCFGRIAGRNAAALDSWA